MSSFHCEPKTIGKDRRTEEIAIWICLDGRTSAVEADMNHQDMRPILYRFAVFCGGQES